MAVTQQDVERAFEARETATAALVAAQSELENTPIEDFQTRTRLEASIQRLQGAADRAEKELNRVSDDFNRQNPTEKPPTPQTPGAAARDRESVLESQERDQNEAETGERETNAERAKRERTEAPKPMTEAQLMAANAAKERIRTTQQSNAQRAQQQAIQGQQQALRDAGVATTTVGSNFITEATARNVSERDVMGTSKDAATTLVTDARSRREQQINIAKSRVDIGQAIVQTALPKVVELMMNTPEGSDIPRQFLLAMLSLSDYLVKEAGLTDIPELDENSPEQRRLRELVGYGAGQPAPRFPTVDEVSAGTTKRLAVWGMPPPGYNGKIGLEALDMPDYPAGTDGTGYNALRDAKQSAEGRAIADEIQGTVAHIEAKAKAGQQLTPEESAQIQAARSQYEARIKQLAEQKKQQRKGGLTPVAAAGTDLKAQVRSSILTGSNEQKLKTMALASTAVANQAAGKPLSPEEIALINNLDPEDLAIMERTMTPQMRAIIQKQQSGQPLTPQEYALVESGVNAMTNDLKQRAPNIPVLSPSSPGAGPQPETPAPETPTAPGPEMPQPLLGPEPAEEQARREQIRREVERERQMAIAQGTDPTAYDEIPVEQEVERRFRGEAPSPPPQQKAMPTLFNPTPFGTQSRAQPEPEIETMPKMFQFPDPMESSRSAYSYSPPEPEETRPIPDFSSMMSQPSIFETEEERRRKRGGSLFATPNFSWG